MPWTIHIWIITKQRTQVDDIFNVDFSLSVKESKLKIIGAYTPSFGEIAGIGLDVLLTHVFKSLGLGS